MIKYLCILQLMIVSSTTLLGSTGNCQLVFQPALRWGGPDDAGWNDKAYKIIQTPFYNVRYYGHPPYEAITLSNPMITNSINKGEQKIESNLLCIRGITIEHDLYAGDTGELRIRLKSSKEVKGANPTLAEAVYIALECIRKTAILATKAPVSKVVIPKVIIVAADTSAVEWSKIADRFNHHDKSKPFVQIKQRKK